MKKLNSLLRFVIMTTIVAAIIANTTSCKNKNNDKSVTADTLLSKRISFPDNLFLLKNTQLIRPDSSILQINNRIKVISIIDGNCVKCIVMQLNKLDSLFKPLLSKTDGVYITILNVHKQDSSYFMHNIQPLINSSGIILWDNNYNFESQNKLFTAHKNLRTFMVNTQNKIIQYGNPIMYPEILSEYRKKIERIYEKENL